jgi:hypothetical protein
VDSVFRPGISSESCRSGSRDLPLSVGLVSYVRWMKPVGEITNEQVVALLPALAEAARADERTANRFVAPRVGILEEVAARHHQFIFGRRGVGKSTLLRKIESLGPTHGDVIFVDIETLRGRPYPDVLIELLIELLDDLGLRLKKKGGRFDFSAGRRRARKEIGALAVNMRRLLNEPQVAQRIFRDLQSSRSRLSGGADLSIDTASGAVAARASAEAERETEREEAREARYEESKMDGLLSAVVLIREGLNNAQAHLDEGPLLIVLDDFYHVPYDAQPDVLAYLHQIVKNLGIYLKICGVRHRIQPFVDGSPPRGLQPNQDAQEVSLDITLEQFTTAQSFLESVLRGICSPLDVELDDLISEGGRQRLVLGSGGVARDYLSLTQRALRIANERDANPSRPHNRIGAEDVNTAAAALSGQKQEDLRLDAGKDADQLRERLGDIVKFCLDVNNTNVFLVEGPLLQEEEWGQEIQALADLRLVHEIGNLSVQTGTYRGRRFVGFTLDLSNYTGTRSERIQQIPFWTTVGAQQTRRARLIYEPGASDRPPIKASESEAEGAISATAPAAQTDIFELLDEPGPRES